MKLIVCLGNPGRQYERTRHNVGFVVGEALGAGWALSTRHKSLVLDGVLSHVRTLILFPQTFMNLSGQAVRSVASFYKLEPKDICIVYDDFDIALGTLRMRSKGSAGTHNGMKSVVSELGTSDFWRLRVGIGPKTGPHSISDFVLSNFLESEQRIVNDITVDAADVLGLWVSGDGDGATRRAAATQVVNR